MEQVQDVMTKDVQIVVESTKLSLAAQKMRDHDCGFLVVGDGQQIVGCVTDRDMVIRGMARELNPREHRVSDVMTRNVVTCEGHTKIVDAVRRMVNEKIQRLVVTDAKSNPIGIVSLSNLAHRRDLDDETLDVLRAVS
jgi:CBS domain-containing protein